jgi:cytochrome c oxidase subunit IV
MSATPIQSQAEDAAHQHPGDNVYFTMLGLLAVLTVVEVIVFYTFDSLAARIGILVALLLVKFVAQVGWFTHLRYDDRRLTLVFGGCFFIALAVMAATVAMMAVDGFYLDGEYP